jgi:hypothetical protein
VLTANSTPLVHSISIALPSSQFRLTDVSLMHFHAGHRIPEALFIKVWQGKRLGSSQEDRRVSCPGSLHTGSRTCGCDAGRGIPHLQVLGQSPPAFSSFGTAVPILLVQQFLLLYMPVCHLCSDVELGRYSL